MAKISTYPKDTNISLTDKLLGTDSDNSLLTKNFEISDFITFLQSNGPVGPTGPQGPAGPQGPPGPSGTEITKVLKTTITSAQVLQLFTTPVTILNSNNPLTVAYPINVYIKRNAGNAYTLAANSFSIINDFDATLTANLNPNPLTGTQAGYFQSSVSPNQNLSGGDKNVLYKLKAVAGDPTLGTGDLEVYVTYIEITL